ncbi:MAG: hypothetical protein JWR09_5303 [Mucilaginibacter sp.]|nr:hypothetical protein [Mucilaginibacter sp.]
MGFNLFSLVLLPQVFGRLKKGKGMCGSPLERGGGMCPLRQAFTLLHGGEHTPATTQSRCAPSQEGNKKPSEHPWYYHS